MSPAASATRSTTRPQGFTVHPKLQAAAQQARRDEPQRRHRLGLRRAARARHPCCSRARRCASPARTRAAARSCSATRCCTTGTTARSGCRSRTCSDDQATFWIYDSLLSEYAAMGFEYGYSVERADALVLLGGPVRRLRQRRPDHHRRVHLVRRAEVGPALERRAAAPPRLRGPGPRPLLRPHRAATCSCAPRTT